MRGRDLPPEDALIAALAGALGGAGRAELGIGDDAAALDIGGGELLLITTDMLMEGVHFRRDWGTPGDLGWKALSQSLSDIAAMGGRATQAVIALAAPRGFTIAEGEALYAGIAEAACASGVEVVGGDTISSSGPLTLGVTVLGRVAREEMVTRGGARAGDALYVTGTLGRAAAGLRALEAGGPWPEEILPAVRAQLRPEARFAAGRALARSGRVTAMMDLSDGLATDLQRMCRRSGTGALLEAELLPVDASVAAACAWLAGMGGATEAAELALRGGEDFELLIAAPAEAEEELRRATAPLALTRIGEMTGDPARVECETNGQRLPLGWGFTHRW